MTTTMQKTRGSSSGRAKLGSAGALPCRRFREAILPLAVMCVVLCPMASPLTPMAIKAAYMPKRTIFAATRFQTGASADNADPCPRMTHNRSAKSARKTQAKINSNRKKLGSSNWLKSSTCLKIP